MMRLLLEALHRCPSHRDRLTFPGTAVHNPPFRADTVGSLLRPPALRQAFRAFHAGELDQERFAAAQDAAIRAAIKMQEDIGLKVVTDGEFRRGSYWGRFVERIEGLSVDKARFSFRDEDGEELAFTAPLVTGKVARRVPIALDEFTFLRANATALPKITLPAPSTMHFWRGAQYANRVSMTAHAIFSASSPRSIALRSPTLPPQVAVISSSTKSRWRCFAIRRCESRSRPTARRWRS